MSSEYEEVSESSYVQEMLTKAYGGLPLPCAAGFEAIDLIRGWLKRQGVQGKGGGVIAVAHADNGHIYFGFSPALQAEIKAKNLANNVRNSHPEKQTYCNRTDQRMSNLRNPGCAEKKIFAEMRWDGRTIEHLTVGEYPEWEINGSLVSHVAGGGGDRAYIAPCRSCIAAYTQFGF